MFSRGEFLVGCTALAFVAGTAHAQTPPAPTAEQASSGVEDIVVTARRVNETAQSVPVSLTAVDAAALTRLGVVAIGDVQKVTPSIVFQQGPSNATGYLIGIRGQIATETVLTQDPSVGVYLDGVYVPRTAGLRGALVDIGRVEVLRGPQGTLYGRNTTGGAVSTYTQDPTDDLGGYIRGRLGNYAERDILAVANLPVAAINGAVRVVLNKGSNHGFGHNAAGVRLAAEDREFGRIKIKSDPTDNLHLMLSADYSNFDTGSEVAKLGGALTGAALLEAGIELGYTPVAGQFSASDLAAIRTEVERQNNNGKYNGANHQDLYDNGKASGVSATISYDASDAITFRSITGFRYASANRNVPLSAGLDFTFINARQYQRTRYLSEELQALGTFDRLNFVVGGYYGREKGFQTSSNASLPALQGYAPRAYAEQYNRVKNTNLSGYAQAGYKITDTLTLTGGIRYAHEERFLTSFSRSGVMCTTNGVTAAGRDIFDSTYIEDCRISPSASFNTTSFLTSLDYKVDQNVLLYAKVSRGFVSGGLNLRGDIRFPDTLAPFKPEKATQFEIGEKADFLNHKLRVNASAYFTKYEDIQRNFNADVPTAQVITNAGAAHIYGFEGEVTARPFRALTISGNVGFTHAKYTSFEYRGVDRSDEAFSFPKWTYALTTNYELPTTIGALNANLNWYWKSKVNLYPSVSRDAEVTQDGFGLLDARLTLTVDAWHTDLAFYGKNLTDKYYKTTANGLDNGVGYNSVSYGRPREIGVEATLHF